MSPQTQSLVVDRKRLLKLSRQLRALIVRTAEAEIGRTQRPAKRFQKAAAELAGAAADLIYELDKKIHDHRTVDIHTGYDDCQSERV